MSERVTLTGDNGGTFVLDLGAPIAYQGKIGCTSDRCSTFGYPDRCGGYHCAVCDDPCSMIGHRKCTP